MILGSDAIQERLANGDITIDPFTPENLNPNSYNYHLGPKLLTPAKGEYVVGSGTRWLTLDLASAGEVLRPGTLYLGSTVETIGSERGVTLLIGRSSVGRLGVYVQIDADLGHQGAVHKWTLEITVVQPIRVYPNMLIGQVSFWESTGEESPYRGSYASHDAPTPSIASRTCEEAS